MFCFGGGWGGGGVVGFCVCIFFFFFLLSVIPSHLLFTYFLFFFFASVFASPCQRLFPFVCLCPEFCFVSFCLLVSLVGLLYDIYEFCMLVYVLLFFALVCAHCVCFCFEVGVVSVLLLVACLLAWLIGLVWVLFRSFVRSFVCLFCLL